MNQGFSCLSGAAIRGEESVHEETAAQGTHLDNRLGVREMKHCTVGIVHKSMAGLSDVNAAICPRQPHKQTQGTISIILCLLLLLAPVAFLNGLVGWD